MLTRHSNLTDIFMISETRLMEGIELYLRGFDNIKKDRRDQQAGGVAILIRHGLLYEEISNIFNCNGKTEICAVNSAILTNAFGLTEEYLRVGYVVLFYMLCTQLAWKGSSV